MISYANRSLRTRAGKLLFGPTGKRLFVDYLDKVPGFCGCIDFIHKTNIPSLYRVVCEAQAEFEAADAMWYPERLEMTYENGRVAFREVKFVTEDDCAVSCQSWTNKTTKPFVLTLEAGGGSEGCETGVDAATGALTLAAPLSEHGYRAGAAIMSDVKLENRPLTVMQGQTVSFTVAAAVGDTATERESMERLAQKAKVYFADNSTDYIGRHRREYRRFYEDAPGFVSSDEILNTTWEYRWYILRNCLTAPDMGYLQGSVMYEGRSHRGAKRPLAPSGWEFSKLINLSTPLHLTDMRWHSDRRIAREMIRNMINNTDENGIFCSAYVDKRLHSYANYSVWAVYKLWLADGDRDFVSEIIEPLKRYVDNERAAYGADDGLQIETTHNRTGKEYQPSYWYFHDYPKNPRDKNTYTPLKRVDRSVYHYLNTLGLSLLCEAIGDADGAAYAQHAEAVKQSILEKMWDARTGFFYDLHHETDEPALVKNIVGVYPYWADISGAEHLKGLELLFDEAHFNTACPFPSVSRECPAYRPAGGWMDTFIKGRDGCVWCGPSWPYTTGIAVDAVGVQSKNHGHKYDGQFAHYLREYSLQHFRDRDVHKPYLVEHYNAETGELLSDDADYNHSFYIDLIISHVAGVGLSREGVTFDPVDIGLDFFVLDNLKLRGANYTVSYRSADCADGRAAELPVGYCVRRNGVMLVGD